MPLLCVYIRLPSYDFWVLFIVLRPFRVLSGLVGVFCVCIVRRRTGTFGVSLVSDVLVYRGQWCAQSSGAVS